MIVWRRRRPNSRDRHTRRSRQSEKIVHRTGVETSVEVGQILVRSGPGGPHGPRRKFRSNDHYFRSQISLNWSLWAEKGPFWTANGPPFHKQIFKALRTHTLHRQRYELTGVFTQVIADVFGQVVSVLFEQFVDHREGSVFGLIHRQHSPAHH